MGDDESLHKEAVEVARRSEGGDYSALLGEICSIGEECTENNQVR